MQAAVSLSSGEGESCAFVSETSTLVGHLWLKIVFFFLQGCASWNRCRVSIETLFLLVQQFVIEGQNSGRQEAHDRDSGRYLEQTC